MAEKDFVAQTKPGLGNNIYILVYARTPSTLLIAFEQGQVDVIKAVDKIIVDEKNPRSAPTRLYIVESENFANRNNIIIGIVYEGRILFVEVRQIHQTKKSAYNRGPAIVRLTIIGFQNITKARRPRVIKNYLIRI